MGIRIGNQEHFICIPALNLNQVEQKTSLKVVLTQAKSLSINVFQEKQ